MQLNTVFISTDIKASRAMNITVDSALSVAITHTTNTLSAGTTIYLAYVAYVKRHLAMYVLVRTNNTSLALYILNIVSGDESLYRKTNIQLQPAQTAMYVLLRSPSSIYLTDFKSSRIGFIDVPVYSARIV